MNEPNDDLILETFNEMKAEAQITPTVLEFPDEVIEAIEAYEKAHSLDRASVIAVAIKAQKGQLDRFVQAMNRRMDAPEAFAWPIDDPLLCVLIAFAWRHTLQWADNVHEKYGLDQDENEPADWWK